MKEQLYKLYSKDIENIVNVKDVGCFLEKKRLDTDLIYSQLSAIYSQFQNYGSNLPDDIIDRANNLQSDSIQYINFENTIRGNYSYLKSTSRINQINRRTSEDLDEYTDFFIALLTDINFDEGMDNPAILFIEEQIEKNELALKDWLGKIYLRVFTNQNLLVKLLYIISDYSYEDLYPVSQSIAIGCMNHSSPAVKSAAMKVFGHWRNKASLDFLLAMDEPKEYWLKLKRNILISQLENFLN